MALLNTEYFTNEDGVAMVRESYDTMVIEREADPSVPEYDNAPNNEFIMEKLESIEAKIQINEDLQTFYDDIVKEVGL